MLSSPICFSQDPSPPETAESLLIIGQAKALLRDDILAALPSVLQENVWKHMVTNTHPGDFGNSAQTIIDGTPRRVIAGVMPKCCSRHNSPSRAWSIPKLVSAAGSKKDLHIVVALEDDAHAYATAIAIARSIPIYTAKTGATGRAVSVCLMGPKGSVLATPEIEAAVKAVQTAAALVDQPPNLLNTNAFVEHGKSVAKKHKNASIEIIQGEALLETGLGGLWGVGKAATEPPALVVLDYTPPNSTQHIAWVGKGIVYDTGGLSIKSKTGMPGMKNDMAGAGAVLSAFDAACEIGPDVRITAVLCIAENAVGRDATRPDDILNMYSGKTVEVNNTDAEGRLVLADGLAWVAAHRNPEVIIDLATLTGAQLTSTGRRHAAVYANHEEIEALAIQAGKTSGELIHPLPYCPEFFRLEFQSKVADMKNSVKDRSNAQSSCAGQFLGNHLHQYDGQWIHVDMAGPSMRSGRATGFGVGLLLTMAGIGAPI